MKRKCPYSKSSNLQNSIEGFCPPSNTLTEPVLEVRHFPPNTLFSLAITPYTYWGKGDTTYQVLRSPDAGKGYPFKAIWYNTRNLKSFRLLTFHLSFLGRSTNTDAVIITFGVLTGVLLAMIITAAFSE